MEMLSECWQTLAIAGLSHSKSIRFGDRNIPTLVIRWAIALSVTTITTLEAIICVKNYGNGFQELLHPIHLVIALFAMLMMYLSLLVQVKEINQLIRYLGKVIDERESVFCMFWMVFRGYHSWSPESLWVFEIFFRSFGYFSRFFRNFRDFHDFSTNSDLFSKILRFLENF